MLQKVVGTILLAFPGTLVCADPVRAADPVRLGLLHTLSPAPFYIAQERGYLRDAGIVVLSLLGLLVAWIIGWLERVLLRRRS
jgi:ABC-type nitrate/sulfonate/bicarbonate transport system substrate-binding protein